MRRRARWAIAAAVLLLAVVGGRLWLRASPDQSARGDATAATPASRSTPLPEATRWAETAAPKPVAASSSPEQLADAQWCREPPEAEEAEPEEGAAVSPPVVATSDEYLEKQRAKPSFQKYNRAENQVRADWARALAAQGGERASAASDFLASASFERNAASLAARDRLLARARVSTDGFVLALALQRCKAVELPAACQGLSDLQWARLDPGNLQPWLAEVGRAQLANDAQALREAMFQMSQSSRSQSYQNELSALLLSLPATDQPGLAMTAQTNLLVTATAAWSIPMFSPITRWCDPASQDANRAQTCAQVAERLWTNANTLIEAVIALNVAKRVQPSLGDTWTKRALTLDALRALSAAENEAFSQEMERLPPGSPLNCVGLTRNNKALRQAMAVGEWPRLLQRLKQSGITEAQQAELAAGWRAEQARQKAQQAAEQAALAASAAVTKP